MNILNAKEYIQTFLKIVDKSGQLMPLILNEPQLQLYETIKAQRAAGKPVRIIILKARQMGFSTMTEAILFFLAVSVRYFQAVIVAHTDQATGNLFRMIRRFYDELPRPLKPMLRNTNARELIFDAPTKSTDCGLGSRIQVATAGGKGIGRGSTIQFLHLSEFAFWPGNKLETYTGIVQAVPDEPGTVIIVESTPNGFDVFKQFWDAAVKAQREGTDGYIPLFFPWYQMRTYRRKPLPGFTRTSEEEELARTFGLDDEQLAWRRWCIAEQCGGDLDLFHQEYPATPDEAFIATGRCAFDQEALVLRREQVRNDVWERGVFELRYGVTGKIVGWRWTPDDKGPIRIRRHPARGVPYVLGGDTAGTGSDMFAGQLLDNRTGEQVAVLHHQFGERMYAEQMYALGMYYNAALIGVETNYSTYPEMVLEELGYPNLYVRERLDTYTGKLADAYGFETTSTSRPVIIDLLKDVARTNLETITDFDTLGEMLTFVYDERWKAQAQVGEHDDLVMALAIAHFIRGQQSTKAEAVEAARQVRWTPDMYEDYRSATEDERALLLKTWGRPEDL